MSNPWVEDDGTLYVPTDSCEEFCALLEKARHDAKELQDTLWRIQNYSFEIKITPNWSRRID